MADKLLIRAKWHDGAFHPAGEVATEQCKRLDENEFMVLELHRERSKKSHGHQFAEITEIWSTLPERLQYMPYAKSPETLRKHALIATGYCDVETIDCGSIRAAERIGVVMSRLATMAHGYAVTSTRGPMVQCFSPHSQSVRAMGRETFQESKTKILDWCADRLGVDADDIFMGETQ